MRRISVSVTRFDIKFHKNGNLKYIRICVSDIYTCYWFHENENGKLENIFTYVSGKRQN